MKLSGGRRRGSVASESAATSPFASGFRRSARLTAPVQVASRSGAAVLVCASCGAGALREGPSITYRASAPAKAPATTAAPSTTALRANPERDGWAGAAGAGRLVRSSRRSVVSNKMWGGRFSTGPDAIMEEINASIGFDQRL